VNCHARPLVRALSGSSSESYRAPVSAHPQTNLGMPVAAVRSIMQPTSPNRDLVSQHGERFQHSSDI